MPGKLTKTGLLDFMKPGNSYSSAQLARHFCVPTDHVRKLLVDLTARGLIRAARPSWRTLYTVATFESSPESASAAIPDLEVAVTSDSPVEPAQAGALLAGYDAEFVARRQLALLARSQRD